MESMLLVNDISRLYKLNQNIVERIGDCANYERRVNINSPLWNTVLTDDGWTLQKDILASKARIIDSEGIQKGNGSIRAMTEKMSRLQSKEFARPGDVLGVSRGIYEHYAIYVGNGRVIHYAGEGSDFGGKITIHEADFAEFIKSSSSFFVLSFAGYNPVKLQSTTKFISNSAYEWYNKKRVFYSENETVKRAYSRIGECNYNLINNNCEHFAIWCKTGISISSQVKNIAKYMVAAGISLQ